jgi:putative ABC transport system substrate-binding protein
MAQTRRRTFITLLGGAAAWPLRLSAQQRGLPLIGLLSPLSAAAAARNYEAFRSGLHDLGYSEGRNFTTTFRFADGEVARLPELAAELVALKAGVIVAGSLPAALAARDATRTIPIVISISQDPMAHGLAASMARPGGNITGFWREGDENLIGKRLELLKDAVPGISRVGVIVNPGDVIDAGLLPSLPAAARRLGLTLSILEARSTAELESVFGTARRDALQGLHVSQTPLFNAHRAEVVAMAERTRLPAIYGFREFALAGGLMSYAANLPDTYRRLATTVVKILNGAKPADLPIERSAKFELVVNLKTAKALGLKISEPFLLLADEVIE